jgi:signal transduction histidine kinase
MPSRPSSPHAATQAVSGGRAWWNPQAAYWLIRVGGFAVIVPLTLARTGSDHRLFVIAVLAVSGMLLALWGALDWRDRRAVSWPAWLRVATLGVLAAVGGTGAALGPARSVVWFAAMAAIAAGNDLSSGPAAAVTAIGVVGVEIGGLIFGFSVSTAVGWPLVLIVSLLAGRNRRDARIRAAQAAALVTRTRQAQSEQRRAAALEERSRIAREIHDVLAHSLAALGVQIETARSVLADTGDLAALSGLLEHASRLADDGLSETRQAIHALRADTPPLPGGLACLARGHEQHYHRPVALSVTGQACPVRPEANVALIRAAREALTNAARHAPGTAVTMNLDYASGQVTLTIANPAQPGPGVAADRGEDDSGSGYGLAGMRERLQLTGGTLTAGPDGGQWVVRAQVPL